MTNTYSNYYDERYSSESPLKKLFKVSRRLKYKEFYRLLSVYVTEGSSVLDVGCGAGDFASSLRKLYSMSACDSAELTMVNNQLKYPDINFFVADATESLSNQEKNTCYDAVTCIDVIEHVQFSQQLDLLQCISAIVKPGGIIILSTPDRNVSLKFKNNYEQSDETFLQQLEQQPRADQLTSKQFDNILSKLFFIEYKTAVVPACNSRIVDLFWKALGFPFGYYGINWFSKAFNLDSHYLVRVVRK